MHEHIGTGQERLARILRAEPAHSGVQLHVHPRRAARVEGLDRRERQELRRPGDHVGVGAQRHLELIGGQRAHHEEPRGDPGRA